MQQRPGAQWLLYGALLSVCLFGSIAKAAPVAYQVELLIFKHEDAQIADGVPAQPFPRLSGALELTETQAGESFHALGSEAFTLSAAASILAGSSGYEVIEHVAWQQPGWNENTARPVHIHGGASYQSFESQALSPGATSAIAFPYGESRTPVTFEELDGTVKVVLGRYLHIYTDLAFRKQATTQAVPSGERLRPANALHEYHVQDQRRMRSRELHYLDHPLVGVLVRITPVEERVPAQVPKKVTTNASDENQPATDGEDTLPAEPGE